jgi:hypothetical protein
LVEAGGETVVDGELVVIGTVDDVVRPEVLEVVTG